MIFTTDLDRTIIFSKRRLPVDLPVVAEEFREGVPVGFLLAEALSAVKKLQKKTIFVANTLRGLEQAKRIQFVNETDCAYISTQNGLYLYYKGKEVQEWKKLVRRAAGETSFSPQRAVEMVLSLSGITCVSKQYEYLTVFFVEDSFDMQGYEKWRTYLSQNGFELFRQGKKLYLSPLAVDKGTVIEFIKERENSPCIGFGDSYFDIPMLQACERAFSLKDSELDIDYRQQWIEFSESPGAQGSKEILFKALEILR